jgi:hypothetical protein
MKCSVCSKIYDLLCAGLTAEKYVSVTGDILRSWKCVACRSQIPKTGNLNTPVRLLMSTTIDSEVIDESTDILQECEYENENVTLRRRQNSVKPGNCPCGDLNSLRTIIREELLAIMRDPLSMIAQLCTDSQNQATALKTIISVQSSILDKLGESVSLPKGKLPSKSLPLATAKLSKPVLQVSQKHEPKGKTIRNRELRGQVAERISPQVGVCSPKANDNSSAPLPGERVERADTEEWTDVKRRRSRASQAGVLRGTASPGTTSLSAAERRRFLHLYYVQEGTTVEQVRAHLTAVCGGDVCSVEELKARGSYASFKLGVPTKLAERVMSADIWSVDICIKPWRQNFRGKQERRQE